jgi:type III restriction enzyme
VLSALRYAFPGLVEIPRSQLRELGQQIEAQVAQYEVDEIEELIPAEVIKREGFDIEPQPDGGVEYVAEISYPVDRGKYVIAPGHVSRENAAGYGFHYKPYNFDSAPEVSYFEHVLRALNDKPVKVGDVYFVGALTDPAKTDLVFEYRGADGKTHYYTPDFLLRCGEDRWLLVEIKRASARRDHVEGEHGLKATAIRALVDRNPGQLEYEMVFATADAVLTADIKTARTFAENCEPTAGL